MTGLTSIADRLTPSAPMEITYGSQPLAVGRKITTLFGHMASVAGEGLPYQVHDMINVGDYVEARKEVEALAGVGSQISLMAEAFVKANQLVSDSRNFPNFRVVLLPYGELHFGASNEAIDAVKGLRSDLLVSCYPASDTTNLNTLVGLAQTISGVDRDLQGQFGTFVCVASIEALSAQIAYAINKREVLVHTLPDTNTAAVTGVTGDTTSGSNVLNNVSSVVGINQGASISGAGIPAGTVVEQVKNGKLILSNAATATAATEDLTIQNQVSQAVEIVAAAATAAMIQTPFPYVPLQGVAIGGLIPPRKLSDRIMIDPNGSSEAALKAGLAPLFTAPGDVVSFIRTRLTYTLSPSLVEQKAYIDWQDVVTLYDFREVCYQITQNPPFNNNPGGAKATVGLADKLKDEVLREAQAFEDQGAFQGVKTLAKQFVVQNSTTMRGRFDFFIPVNVVPGLMVIAGNIQAVSGTNFGDFTL